MQLTKLLEKLLQHQNLTSAEMRDAMQFFMTGKANDAQIAGFLCALRSKGETIDEITAAAEVMRELATPIEITGEHVIDTCGTGGDGANTFNISTTSAFIVAAAGGQVAKHGNRSVSSCCGSADVLELAGVDLNLSPEQVAQCIATLGIGFLFAQKYHGAMQHTRDVRKSLGVRNVFNLLGPLANPAKASHQLIGVFDKKWVEPLAHVFKKLGSKHVLVVSAEDGLDEISIACETHVAELKNGEVFCYAITPEQFNLPRANLESIAIKNTGESLTMLKNVLDNQTGAAKNIVLLNAGAAIYAADLVDSLAAGIVKADEMITNGTAYNKFKNFINFTQTFTS
ncbi:MAG: anthranilate phosphoribosyltransferase [Methylococcales bacterium]|nr:anthranilate phosphoribosyltransferase [Methylococcales bacterium]MDD5754576.1 anthranilate phosphoribosyltransferase [Methylococcales bacterium]